MNKRHDLQFKWNGKKEIPVCLFLIYFLIVTTLYLKENLVQNLSRPFLYIIILLWLALTFFALLEIKAVRDYFQRNAKWINYVVLILCPPASFLVVESMVSNFNLNMFMSYSLYNLIWYVVIYYLIFAVTGNSKLTITVGNLAVYMASMVNYFVYLFRGNPVLPSDLLAWQTGMSVASNYHVRVTDGFLISTLIMYFVYLLGYKLEKPDKKPSVLSRFCTAGSFVIFAAVIFNLFFETDLVKSKIAVLDFFAPKYTYCSYGTAFGFVANVQAMETEAPDGYSVKSVKSSLNKADKEVSSSSVIGDKPNIIVIMNESFSDLSMIGNFKTNMDYLPYIRSLTKNTIKGTMYTSVFGGATSDTEYEFLTGNSMAVMPANCVPYQQFVTESRDSLAVTLKDQGYYDIAIHPYEPSGYKRDIVYPLLGFDEFLSMKDFTKPKLIRSFISDRSSYQKIIEEYKKKSKAHPLFIFNVTMQNHGGYSAAQLFDDKDTVRLTEYTGFPCAEQYLSLLRQSDQAFKTLIDYFSKQKKHTIILLFGDHQPVAYSELHDLLDAQGKLSEAEALQRKYMVPFILWSNYDLPDEKLSETSANYLSTYLLKTAGLKGTAYNQYLYDLSKKIPVINALFYKDQNNKFHSYSQTSIYSNLISEYRCVGYNNALDNKNRLKKYYYLR